MGADERVMDRATTPPAASTVASTPSPGPSADGDRGPIVYVLYWQRWFILTVFSLLACHQVLAMLFTKNSHSVTCHFPPKCLVWNTYGPIDEAMDYAYGWSDGTVAFMANWGTIMFVVAVVPLSLMLEKRYSHCKLNGNRMIIIIKAIIVQIGSNQHSSVLLYMCTRSPQK